jgi:hypothetical protein
MQLLLDNNNNVTICLFNNEPFISKKDREIKMK